MRAGGFGQGANLSHLEIAVLPGFTLTRSLENGGDFANYTSYWSTLRRKARAADLSMEL